jgi:hypothetical protein
MRNDTPREFARFFESDHHVRVRARPITAFILHTRTLTSFFTSRVLLSSARASRFSRSRRSARWRPNTAASPALIR